MCTLKDDCNTQILMSLCADFMKAPTKKRAEELIKNVEAFKIAFSEREKIKVIA